MAARTNPTGEWCSPTREIPSPRLSRLLDESRHDEDAETIVVDTFVAERIHDAPARECGAAAVDVRARGGCTSMLIDLHSLGDPDAPAIAEDVAAPDPGPVTLHWEPEVEEATATLTYEAMPGDTMSHPAAPAPAPRIATGARRDRERVARIRLLLCLSVLLVVCLGVIVFLGLGAWGVTDASLDVSLGL